MKIKYLISSHKSYYNFTVNKLVESLKLNGINECDIFITSGGFKCEQEYVKNGILHHNVITNSFDLTSLIEVVKKNLFQTYDYIFLLHDTCEVGVDFKNRLCNLINNNSKTIALFGATPSSNIGIYKREYLTLHRDYILTLENQTKDFYVENEDVLLIDKNIYHFSHLPQIVNNGLIYSDTPREINYSNEIDLYKYKANNFVRVDWIIKP